jgi:hypothetical protein
MKMSSGKPSRRNRHPWFVTTFALLVTFQLGSPAWAWGRLGHRVISRIAENQLTPKAKAAIAALLPEGECIADASTWADGNRGRLPKTAPWHYVDVPLDEPRYDRRFSADVPQKGFIVDKIHEFQAILKDPDRSIEDCRFSLRFLIHLIEDLHMPLHVGDNHDKEGNQAQVRFFTRGSNMHRLWDSDMIERVGRDEDFWLADLARLDTADNRITAMSGPVEDWATESLVAARLAYRLPGTMERLKSGQKLSDAYLDANLPVVRRRLYQAGVRLAMVLNDPFTET